jgi:hypothetical protein
MEKIEKIEKCKKMFDEYELPEPKELLKILNGEVADLRMKNQKEQQEFKIWFKDMMEKLN